MLENVGAKQHIGAIWDSELNALVSDYGLLVRYTTLDDIIRRSGHLNDPDSVPRHDSDCVPRRDSDCVPHHDSDCVPITTASPWAATTTAACNGCKLTDIQQGMGLQDLGWNLRWEWSPLRQRSEVTVNAIIESGKLVRHRWGVGFDICHSKAIRAAEKRDAIQECEEDPTGIHMGKPVSVWIGVHAGGAVACDGCAQDTIVMRELLLEIGGISRETGRPM